MEVDQANRETAARLAQVVTQAPREPQTDSVALLVETATEELEEPKAPVAAQRSQDKTPKLSSL